MEVLCYKCGAKNWLENEMKCHSCSSVLRRCIDCTNYTKSLELCRARNIEVDGYEAEHPSLLGSSTCCREYRPAQSGEPRTQVA